MSQPGIWPRTVCRTTESEAERDVYAALANHLPKGWYAWHSLRIRTESGSDGEGDFVIADPRRGLLILEVKGGLVNVCDGRWLQNGVAMKQAPREQANRFGRRLVERLAAQRCTPPAWGIATCFPDTEFEQQPTQDDVSGRIIGRQDLSWLGHALKDVMDRALAHHCGERGAWVEELHRMWGETWAPRLRLGQRIRLDEEERHPLDASQFAILQGLGANESLLVEGGAGTGKTLLAREAALRLASDGKKVLLLCFTEPLAKWLSLKAEHENLKVSAVRQFAVEVLRDAGMDAECKDPPTFWREVSWRAAAEALPLVERKWDALVVDEGQDLTPEDWMLVEELARGKRLWAFCVNAG